MKVTIRLLSKTVKNKEIISNKAPDIKLESVFGLDKFLTIRFIN